MNIDLSNHICFKVITPNDLEDERKEKMLNRIRRMNIKLSINYAIAELKKDKVDKKFLEKILNHAKELVEVDL